MAPAARPSTATRPLAPTLDLPWTSKAQASPRSMSARSRRAWSGSARMRALITVWGSASATPRASAQTLNASSPDARTATPPSIPISADSKASAEA